MGLFLLDPRYLVLKFAATLVRTVHSLGKLWRRWKWGGYNAGWETSWGRWSKEYTIPSSISSRQIRIRVWSPPSSSSTSESGTLRPVHINFHGSAHLIRDDYGNDSDFCEYLAKELDITVLDCDYAKGPEYPYPHGATDAHDILAHLVHSCSSLYDLSNLTVSGFSAGGGLALGLAASDDELSKTYVKALVGVYPWVDVTQPRVPAVSGRPGSTAVLIQPLTFALAQAAYAQPPFRGEEAQLSPGLLPDAVLAVAFKGPRAKRVCFVVGECDTITAQVERLAGRMKGLGVDLAYEQIKDVGHAWDKTNTATGWEAERKAQAYAFIADFLRGVYKSK